MNDEIAKTFGLSPAHTRLLRCLYQFNDQVGRGRVERRRWLSGRLRAGDAVSILDELERRGFLTSDHRLTWVGLTVAVNLPAVPVPASDPLAA